MAENIAFKNRVALLQSGLSAIVKDRPVRWQSYVLDYSIDEESVVTYFPKPMDEKPSNDLEELFKYIRFCLGQGFFLEIAVCIQQETLQLHILHWEEEEAPTWPDAIQPLLLIRSHDIYRTFHRN